MGERLHFRFFGTFEAEVIGDGGKGTLLRSAAFRPMMKLLVGVIVEDGGDNMGVDVGRAVRVLWDETVSGPGDWPMGESEPGFGQGYAEAKTGDEIARARFNRTLNELRRAIGDRAANPRFLDRKGDQLKLLNTTTDVNEFRDLWAEERFEEALALIERGVFLSGTRLQQRNESAQLWLETARKAWSDRIDGFLAGRERASVKQNDREAAFRWGRARKRLADAYGYRELIERASYDMHDFQDPEESVQPDGEEAPAGADGLCAEVAAHLDRWGLDGAEENAVVGIVLGHRDARRGLPEVAGLLSARGVATSVHGGGFGRFGHASATLATLKEATHCIYLLADGEEPVTGWAAFVGAAAGRSGVPFGVVRLATEGSPAP